MPLDKRPRDFLEARHADFTLTTHSKAYTAREVAAAEGAAHADGGMPPSGLASNRLIGP